jgi:hypothetical protein
MKERRLIKYVSYLPKESLAINSVSKWFNNWGIPISFVSVIVVVLLVQIIGGISFLIFFVSTLSLFFFATKKNNNISNLEFTTTKVIIKRHNLNEDQQLTFHLKSPMYLDVIVKPRKELLLVTFEQFGETIGSSLLPPDELTYMLDSLSDLLGIEIHETRSTNKQEDVLYLRPIGSNDNLLPSYLKITDNPMRLIVNPVENSQNFIINYQRKIIKTANGNVYPLDDIQTINLTFTTDEILITGLKVNYYTKPFEIITFSEKGYDADIIKKDLQLLADFLKSKPVLNHITFQVLD